MLIRKYRAKNLKEALKLVKQELGEEATILSSRTVRSGFLTSQLEVTATLPPMKPAPSPAAGASRSVSRLTTLELQQMSRFVTPLRQDVRALYKEIQTLKTLASDVSQVQQLQQLEQSIGEIRQLMTELQQHRDRDEARAPAAPCDRDDRDDVLAPAAAQEGAPADEAKLPGAPADEAELQDATTREETPLHQTAPGDVVVATSVILRRLHSRLLQAGMRSSLAERVVGKVASRIPADPADAELCVDTLAAACIGEDLDCTPPLELPGRSAVAAMVGPPGVGKTTTLAKIAARAALIHDRRVALVGCRVDEAGAATLERIANLIGIPCDLVDDADQLVRAIKDAQCDAQCPSPASSDLVLVDTHVGAVQDHESIGSLQRMLEAAGVESHLVLNADMRPLEIDTNLRAFLSLEPRSLIFTRVDQTGQLGGLYDAAYTSHLPMMYTTNGRRIPEDIERATPHGITSMLMGFQYQ